jgi:hypothetical protein
MLWDHRGSNGLLLTVGAAARTYDVFLVLVWAFPWGGWHWHAPETELRDDVVPLTPQDLADGSSPAERRVRGLLGKHCVACRAWGNGCSSWTLDKSRGTRASDEPLLQTDVLLDCPVPKSLPTIWPLSGRGGPAVLRGSAPLRRGVAESLAVKTME